jgi:hypothetical protein
MKTFGVLDSSKFQAGRFTGCIYSIAADFFSCFIVADSFQFARFEGYVVESKEKIVLAFAFTQGVTIRKSSTSSPVDTTCTGFTVLSG